MIQATLDKLSDMKLYAMAEKAKELNESPNASNLEPVQFLSFCVDAEHHKRKQSRLRRLLKNARIKFSTASIEEIDFKQHRNLTKESMGDIISGTALENKCNILISGSTGVGKSFISCAIANLACRKNLPTQYFRISRFLEYMAAQKALGQYLKTIEKIGSLKLLVLEDLGPDVMTAEQRNMFMEVIEERYLVWPTIITSQLPFEQWYDVFGDQTVADAICDRIFHNAKKLRLEGDSMRKSNRRSAP
ncbi:MAG: AAA family ATPase [Chitinivibrionales bacterium]|nr:AAA family ATPase [Chitinivibrionales bacterium]